jgi:prepilin-type N-terminal cleavage/methylation domain-containing protein
MLKVVVANGFSLMETLIALAIMAILAAVVVPTVASRLSPSNSAVLASNLQLINAATLEYRENVGKYPNELLDLTTKPTAGVSLDACGAALSTTPVASWRGPYLSLSVNSSGIQSGDGLIANTISRTPSSTSLSTVMKGVLQFSVSGVTQDNADDLESLFDTGSDLTTGTVQWVANSSTGGTLTYAIPIRGC